MGCTEPPEKQLSLPTSGFISCSPNSQAEEAMATYRTCIADANTQKQELEDTKVNSLRQIHELIKQSDQVIKLVSRAGGRILPSSDEVQEGTQLPRAPKSHGSGLQTQHCSGLTGGSLSLSPLCVTSQSSRLVFSTLLSGHNRLLPDHAHADSSAARLLPDAVREQQALRPRAAIRLPRQAAAARRRTRYPIRL